MTEAKQCENKNPPMQEKYMLIQKYYHSFCRVSWRRVLHLSFAVLSTAVFVQAALAQNITVGSPLNGATTQSPLLVKAHNVGCNGLAPTAFAFMIDNSSTAYWGATPYDIDVTNTSVSVGKHIIRFKAWTSAGICPEVDSTIQVTTGTPPPGGDSSGGTSDTIPSNALASADLDTLTNWAYEHDAGTPGTSRGSTLFPATTPLYDDAREFYMTYSNRGGERFHNSFARDTTSTHFIMDTYVYVVNPDQLANLELDLNQVMSDGRTVIFGTQCSTYSHTWEWSYYGSTGGPHWHPSNIPCDTRKWTANTWHHIQVAFHRDSNGYVTHDWVNFDGTHTNFSGAAAGSAKALGWAKGSMIMNIQMDGYNKTSGNVTAYFHKTTYYRW
jgi:hypothetical protein